MLSGMMAAWLSVSFLLCFLSGCGVAHPLPTASAAIHRATGSNVEEFTICVNSCLDLITSGRLEVEEVHFTVVEGCLQRCESGGENDEAEQEILKLLRKDVKGVEAEKLPARSLALQLQPILAFDPSSSITITMSVTKRDQIPTSAPSSTSTGIETTPTQETEEPAGNNSSSSSPKLPTAALAGIISGVVVVLIIGLIFLFSFLRKLNRKRAIAKAEKLVATPYLDGAVPYGGKGKNFEFLTLNLEASPNPWNFSPVGVVDQKSLPWPKASPKAKTQAQLPELDLIIPEPAAVKYGSNTVIETTRPAAQKRKSSITQAMKKLSVSLSSFSFNSPVVGSSSGDKAALNSGASDHHRNTPSPWAWGNSVNSHGLVEPVDYLGYVGDVDPLDPQEKALGVDELVGVAVSYTRPVSDNSSGPSQTNPKAQAAKPEGDSSPKGKERQKAPAAATGTSPKPKQAKTFPVIPPPKPPPTDPLPPPPVQDTPPPLANQRRPSLPTMTIPVPSATSIATANLATFTLLHQSLCANTNSVYTCFDETSPSTVSPVSTRYTYCEGMSPSSPYTPSHACATNHSSCVWSSSSGTPRSSRHTLSMYSLPSTPGYQYRPSTSTCCGSCSTSTPPVPAVRLPQRNQSGEKTKPKPLVLNKGRSPKLEQLVAGEMQELPPSPQRLPEEIERVTREIRERQQEDVLRRMFGEGPSGSGGTPAPVVGTPGVRGRSGSVATLASTRRDEPGLGLYGQVWPTRI